MAAIPMEVHEYPYKFPGWGKQLRCPDTSLIFLLIGKNLLNSIALEIERFQISSQSSGNMSKEQCSFGRLAPEGILLLDFNLDK